MELSRLIFYGVGFTFSLALVAQFARQRHPLARMLAALLAVWAVNCVVLFVLLLMMEVGSSPPWASWAFTVNSFLLALGPVALYAWFLVQDGEDRRG